MISKEGGLKMGKNFTTITLSRQWGSGGSFIGYSVAKKLGFQYVDREILRQAAERLGTAPGSLEYLDERSATFLETLVKGFSFGMPEISVPLPQGRPVDHRELFTVESKIMNEIADRYNAIIVGRAGFYALRDRPEVIKVFIHAPHPFRAKRIMESQKTANLKEIQARIKESDQARAKFVRDMAGVNWLDTRNYHLSVDSSVVDFETIIEWIIKLVKKKRA
jgi:cytidylate kinase